MKRRKSGREIIFISVCLALLISVCAIAQEPEVLVSVERIDIGNVDPAPILGDAVQQGLSVMYYKNYSARNLDNLPQAESAVYPSFQGEPISQLNHHFGKSDVFGSGINRLVGMRMKGYLNLSETGIYEFQALANDGITVIVSGKTLLTDPTQHADRLSPVGLVTVKAPGWYPVTIEYFQRKGTAALVLFWKTPGSKKFMPIPKEIYGYLP